MTTKTTTQTTIITPIPVIRITREELVQKLFDVKGVTFVQMFSTTVPKMNKTNNKLFGNVVKDSITNSMLGFDYENSVKLKRQRKWTKNAVQSAIAAGIPKDIVDKIVDDLKKISNEKTEIFVAKGRKWGEHMINPFTDKVSRILVEYTKKDGIYNRYVQLAVIKSQKPTYRYKDTGEELTEDDVVYIKQFIPKTPEQEIVIRDYSIENITRIHMNGVQCIIISEAETKAYYGIKKLNRIPPEEYWARMRL